MNDVESESKQLAQKCDCLNVSKGSPARRLFTPQLGDTGGPMSVDRVLHGGCFNFFRGFCSEAVSSIVGDCPINDCSAVDTFPCIEAQEKIREPFQHHQTFALRAIHDELLPRL